jgi:predicted ATPase/class 3 adenylate cyclase/Tfp pilus assembly protein PilF
MADPTLMPTGTVTLMFTDIEGSTALWEKLKNDFYPVLEKHNSILREAITNCRGYEVKTEGDAFMAAFPTAADGVRCTIAAQLALAEATWPAEVGEVRVRMGLHTGDPIVATHPDGMRDYFGPMVNRSARVAASGHGGQVVLSDAARHAAMPFPDGVVPVDLGRHQLKGLDQLEQIWQLDHPSFPIRKFPPLKTLNAVRHNLPLPVSSFIGRTTEVAEIRALLSKPENRLVTMLGTGGTGKTRLSQHVAAECADEFPDGVWFVELADLTAAANVPQAVLNALSVRPLPTRDLKDQLLEYLAGKELLLVLDNTEQIPDIAKFVTDVQKAATSIKLLVTTRIVLNLRGERTYAVPPLPLPEENETQLDKLTSSDAVCLFAERSKEANSSFELNAENGPQIGRLVNRLDGLPLAIELAAARMRSMSVQQILDRLSRRLDLLATKRADLPARQQTIRGAIDWSYDLLSEDQKKIFQLLSVFVGGFFLESAAAVCAEACGIDEFELEEAVGDLRDKSLLYGREIMGMMRYGMYESIREYAAEKLKTGDDPQGAAKVQMAHSNWYLKWAEQHDAKLHTTDTAWKLMELNLPNLRAAMDTAAAAGRDDVAAKIALATCPFLGRRGYWSERLSRGLAGLQSARKAFGETHIVIARLMKEIAVPYQERGEFEESRKWYNQSLQMCEAVGEKKVAGLIFNNLSMISKAQGDLAAARELGRKSLDVMRELSDDRGSALSLNNLALLALEAGQFTEATQLHEESLKLRRKLNDRVGVASSLNNLGVVSMRRGDLAQAKQWYEEALTELRALRDDRGVASCLHNLARIAKGRGDVDLACQLAAESLDIRKKLGDKSGIALAMTLLSNLACEQCQLTNARKMAEEALHLWEEVGNVAEITRSMCNLGDICLTLYDYGRANDLYDRALVLARKRNDQQLISGVLVGMARAAAAEGQDRLAIRLFKQARRVYWRQGAAGDLAEVMSDLSRLYGRLGRPRRRDWSAVVAQHFASLTPGNPELKAATSELLTETDRLAVASRDMRASERIVSHLQSKRQTVKMN